MFTACHALYGPHEEEKENFPAGANPCFNAGSDGDTEIPRDFRQDKWKPIKAKLTGVTQLAVRFWVICSKVPAACAALGCCRLHYAIDGLDSYYNIANFAPSTLAAPFITFCLPSSSYIM